MFIVGDLEFWSVYDGVVGSKKGESKAEEQSETNRSSQTRFNTTLSNLP